MKKKTIIQITLGILFATLLIESPKTYDAVLTKSGFTPATLRINKGDSVNFTTEMEVSFWPASDPHPSHTDLQVFDPRRELKSNDAWTYKFVKAGTFGYHDHVDPRYRGTVIVVETDPLEAISSTLLKFYRHKLEKHDTFYVARSLKKCEDLRFAHGDFETCVSNFFSVITSDFGAAEAMRLLKMVYESNKLTLADCHYMADQIGTDAYWQYTSGKKFTFTKDFAVCDSGFFHHFMSEYVSHGQDIKSAENFCDSLDPEVTDQCYFGLGNGLAYYYWDIYGGEDLKIMRDGLKSCGLIKFPATCQKGVISGIDHLYESLHGSDLKIRPENPFAICSLTQGEILDDCFERMIPALNAYYKKSVGDNVPLLVRNIYKIPTVAGQMRAAGRVGIMLGEEESQKDIPDYGTGAKFCALFTRTLAESCDNSFRETMQKE